MSNYDDPRWYEQPEQGNTSVPPAQPPYPVPIAEQPPYSDYSQYPPHQVPGNGAVPRKRMYPQEPSQLAPEPRRWRGRGFGQYVVVLALLVITFFGGWFGNQLYANSFNRSNLSQSYANLYQQAWNIVDQNYVDRKAVDYKQMSYKSIQAMLDVLHDKGHTRFLTPEDVQTENQQLSGTFTGVGIYLKQDPKTKDLIITSPIPRSPPQKPRFNHPHLISAPNPQP